MSIDTCLSQVGVSSEGTTLNSVTLPLNDCKLTMFNPRSGSKTVGSIFPVCNFSPIKVKGLPPKVMVCISPHHTELENVKKPIKNKDKEDRNFLFILFLLLLI